MFNAQLSLPFPPLHSGTRLHILIPCSCIQKESVQRLDFFYAPVHLQRKLLNAIPSLSLWGDRLMFLDSLTAAQTVCETLQLHVGSRQRDQPLGPAATGTDATLTLIPRLPSLARLPVATAKSHGGGSQ